MQEHPFSTVVVLHESQCTIEVPSVQCSSNVRCVVRLRGVRSNSNRGSNGFATAGSPTACPTVFYQFCRRLPRYPMARHAHTHSACANVRLRSASERGCDPMSSLDRYIRSELDRCRGHAMSNDNPPCLLAGPPRPAVSSSYALRRPPTTAKWVSVDTNRRRLASHRQSTSGSGFSGPFFSEL